MVGSLTIIRSRLTPGRSVSEPRKGTDTGQRQKALVLPPSPFSPQNLAQPPLHAFGDFQRFAPQKLRILMGFGALPDATHVPVCCGSQQLPECARQKSAVEGKRFGRVECK